MDKIPKVHDMSEELTKDEVFDMQIAINTTEGLKLVWHKEDNEPFYFHELFDYYMLKKLRGRKKAFDDNELLRLLEDRQGGMSIRELAKKYKKSKTTIHKYLRRAGM